MRHDITELFCFVDDFCKELDDELKKHQLSQSRRKPTRTPGLTDSEMVTILLMFQVSHMKDFKSFYLHFLPDYRDEFPKMPCYERFVILQPRIAPIMLLLFMSLRKNNSDTAFVDSTPIRVCHNKRIFNHKVFDGIAARGKSTMGWFFGFKLHLMIDECGEIINAQLTSGSCDDRAPVEDLVKHFRGKLFGDKGYICQELFQKLYQKGVKLVTGIKKRMKNMFMDMKEKILLRKRSIIETVIGYLKRTLMLEHTRHRSQKNMGIHVMSTLVAYQLLCEKPAITPIFQMVR